MQDPFDLARFVEAQAPAMPSVRRELGAGRKESHWMWFVFPQLRGLGHSAMAHRYGIASLAEARAYLAHPVLGPRLRETTALVNGAAGRPIRAILGSPDDLKFQASMTLFEAAAPAEPVFAAALGQFFGGVRHAATREMLAGEARLRPGP